MQTQSASTRIKQWLSRMALKSLSPVDQSRGWIPVFQESYMGAFQIDDPVSLGDALAHPTVYACVTQIAGDIGKLRLRMTELKEGIWQEVPAYNPIFKRPNKYQTRQQFIEAWLISKLTYGNTYVLKQRDQQGRVAALYVLDPNRVSPLISESGDVFYRLQQDYVSRVEKDIPAVPAYEMIHDRMDCLFHPLVGVPPLYAASLAVSQGLAMQQTSARFFQNNAQPGGVLTAPGHIKDDTAERIKTSWKEKYTGDNAGKIAVLGDGLKYEPLAVTAKESTMVEQLKWSDEKVCSVYKVPPYKVYVGQMPTYQQSETLDRAYYSGCLQKYIESIEALLDDGLGLPQNFGAEFNLDDLMRMDTALKMETAAKGVGGGIMSPNEARMKFDLPPVTGGDTPYLQQQNYSLSALDERDKTNPLAAQEPAPEPETPPTEPIEPDADDEDAKAFILAATHEFAERACT
jgi:HK97 family phage portal protein